MLFDLHCHSTASDGSLTASELVQRAQQVGIDVLAITDHDTIAGIRGLNTDHRGGLTLLPGVELSARWGAVNVHIIGLNFQMSSGEFNTALCEQQQIRRDRAVIIAERLRKKGLPDLLPAVIRAAGQAAIGRPHFAQQLVDIEAAKSHDEAFQKYLGAGKVGDVKMAWPSLKQSIAWIRDAGGNAVLAHPDKYRLTQNKLIKLLTEFKAVGGEAIEVVSGHQASSKTDRLAELSLRLGLLASCGSDFHKPGIPWAELGGHPALPDDCIPIWDRW